ncbi:MAG: methyl-accepting chemotaxis protein, partial [Planctomycetota bacterium]
MSGTRHDEAMLSGSSLRRELILLPVLAIVTLGVLGVVVATLALQRSGARQLASYRSDQLAARRQRLMDCVDVAYAGFVAKCERAGDKQAIIERYGAELRSILDVAENAIRTEFEPGLGDAGRQAAQSRAKAAVAGLRYGPRNDQGEQRGYVWINDMGTPCPKMVMHPAAPQLAGVVMDDAKYDCVGPEHKNLFVAFRETCAEDGEGFVLYSWPRPGYEQAQRKLGYVRLIPEWNWVIGTGVYVEDAVADAIAVALEDLRGMRYGPEDPRTGDPIGYFWINDMGEPFPRMVMHPTAPQLEGVVMDDPKYDCALGQSETNLFVAFRDICAENGAGFVDYSWPKPGAAEPQPKLGYVRLYEPLDWIIGTGVYIDDIEQQVAQKRAAVEAQTRALLWWLIPGVLVASAAVALVLSFRANSRMVRPLRRLVGSIRHLGAGDAAAARTEADPAATADARSTLAVVLAEMGRVAAVLEQRSLALHAVGGGDLARRVEQLGERDLLGQGMCAVTDNLGAMVGTIRTSAAGLGEAAGDLERISAELEQGASEMAGRSSSLTEFSEAMSAHLGTIASSGEEMSVTIDAIASAVEQMATSVAATGEQAEQGEQIASDALGMAETANGKMNTLGTNASEIGQVTEVIKNIAQQTNLLALNATIEAASAGEAGRGFAVVAAEIKELAAQSSQAAGQIAGQIETMQEDTTGAIRFIEQVADIVRRLSESMHVIASGVEEQKSTAA